MTTRDFLLSISEISGTSGFETRVSDFVRKALSEYCDDITVDALGNVIAVKHGYGEGKLMYCAHMDEVGMVVTYIEEDGKIRLSPIGGVDPRAFLYQKVMIRGKKDVEGFVDMTLPEGSSPDSAPDIEDLFIYTGLSPVKVRELIRPGNAVTSVRSVLKLQHDRLTGKAMDDRAGCACLFECAKLLKNYKHKYTVYFVFSVQEEVGCRGAGVATEFVDPDIGIAVDTGFARNPDFPTADANFDKGPLIAVGPNFNYKLVKRMQSVASKNFLPYQMMNIAVPKGSDASSIQIRNDGIYSGLIAVPLRYMHTSAEVVSFGDIESTGKLMADLVIDLDEEEFVGI